MSRRKYNRIIPIVGMVVVALTVLIVLFSGAAGVTQAAIEKRLQEFSQMVSEAAKQNGKEAAFTYGPIEFHGWGYNKYASVANVNLELTRTSVLDATKWSFTTPSMQIRPNPAGADALMFVFPEPVSVNENGQARATVTFSAPPQYGYFDGNEKGKRTIINTIHLPNQITLTPVADAGAEKPGNIVATYDEKPVLRTKFRPETGEREALYEFRNLKIAADDGTQATVASLISNMTETRGADQKPQGNYKLMIVDLAFRDAAKSTKAYTINADVDYSGDASLAGMADADMTVKQFLVATDDFKIHADGTLSTATDDPLPSGSINLAIDNVKQFVASELVPEPLRPVVSGALQKITGKPLDSLDNIAIVLKREKKGIFYIGDITFEELAASVMGDMMQTPTPSTPVPEQDNVMPNPQAPAESPESGTESPTESDM